MNSSTVENQKKTFYLEVWNASAGSGKTTLLIGRILNLLLQPNNKTDLLKDNRYNEYIKRICGLTFTNAVANELKNRLVETLNKIIEDVERNDEAALEETRQKYFKEGISINKEILRERSKTVLSYILHHYSDVTLTTMDSFFNRIMRSFAYELNYSTNYEIAPNAQDFYLQAIDEFLDQISTDDYSYLHDVLTFLKSEEDSYTSINTFISSIRNLLSALVEKELDENVINEIRKNIRAIYEKKELQDIYKTYYKYRQQKIEEFNQKVRKDIEEIGQPYYKIEGSELKKHNNSKIDGRRLKGLSAVYREPYENFIYNSKGENKWEKGFFPPDYESDEKNLRKIYDQNIDAFNQIRDLGWFKILFDKLSITRLGIELLDILNTIKANNNIAFFSDATKEISKIVQSDTPAAFIYERVGIRYNHYLIDEFQDTSLMQFNNLLPLIHNSMASGNTNYIVGDPKQSIYKWRNANVKQFIDLYEKRDIPLEKLENWDKFKGTINTKSLSTNYRSTANIVHFNNLIFNELKYKNYTLIESVYKNAKQEIKPQQEKNTDQAVNANQSTNCKDKGYVEIIELTGANKDDKIKIFKSKVIEKINECLQKGYEQKDICILLRSNSDIRKLIEITGEQLINGEKLSFVSPEGLLVDDAKHIAFIVAFLKQTLNPDDKLSAAVCWKYTEGEFKVENSDKNDRNENDKKDDENDEKNKNHSFIKNYVRKEDNLSFLDYLAHKHSENNDSKEIAYFSREDVYRLVLDAIHYFKLPFDKYTQKFLDIVNKFTYKYSQANTIYDFLNFWEENKDQFGIEASKDTNAVKVITIHKSKGLEFPIVMTWLNFEIREDFYHWIRLPDNYTLILPPIDNEPEGKKISDFKNMYFYLNLKEIKDIDESQYNKLSEEEYLENINLIYVAFTRAIDRLYIFANKKDENQRGPNNKTNTYYESLIEPKKEHFRQIDEYTYSFGNPDSPRSVINEEENEGDDTNVNITNSNNSSTNKQKIKQKEKISGDIQLAYNFNYAIANNAGYYSKEQKTGIEIHKVLEYLNNNDVESAIKKAHIKGIISTSKKEEISRRIQQLVAHPLLQQYFQTENILEIRSEAEIYSIKDQQLHRPDKLLFTKDNTLVVLEFKTGIEEEKHKSQVKEYMSILKDIYVDKKIKGFLIYLPEDGEMEVQEIVMG